MHMAESDGAMPMPVFLGEDHQLMTDSSLEDLRPDKAERARQVR